MNSGSGVVDSCPTADRERRGQAEGVHDGDIAAVEARNVDSVEFPDGAVGALLARSGEVDVSELVPVEAFMPANAGRVEHGEREARQSANVYFVGGQPGRGADGVVVGAFDVRKMQVPIAL